MIRVANYIDGKLVAPLSNEYIISPNPTTEEAHLEIPKSGAEDVERAVRAAKAAFKSWSTRPVEDRADFLDRIADEIEKRRDEFARAESLDQGKTIAIAKALDVPRAIHNFRFFAGAARHATSKSAPLGKGMMSYVRREPIGVAGLISPWNLPLYLLTWKIAPAIVYGNTCVAKPSELTSHTAALLTEVFNEVGLPNGVVNLVFGLGAEAGQAIVEHPDVPLISFTGGTVTGQKISETVAPKMIAHGKRLSLELGGKNPTIVFADADLRKHLKTIVRSAFLNQGEICLCGSRIYVERSIYKSFVDGFVLETKGLKVGDPAASDTFMGPLVSREHREKVSAFVDEARASGMTVQCGGGVPNSQRRGFFYEPTVITVDEKKEAAFHESRIQNEEVFGPVVTIAPFDSVDDVVSHANATRYGLAASIWTESLSKAHAVSARLQAGTVWVNTWMSRDLRMPFGGVKESGLGREGQDDSIHFFTEAKTVCIRYE